MTKLRPAAKAIVPPLLGLLGALGQYLITGHVDQHAILTFGVGLIAGAVTYLVPNAPGLAAADALFSPVSAGHPDPPVQPEATVPAAVAAPAVPAPESPAAPTPPQSS